MPVESDLERAIRDGLVDRCCKGEVAAWNTFVGGHRQLVLKVLMRATMNREATRDLEQDVWLSLLGSDRAAMRKLVGVSPVAVRAYLVRAAINKAVDWRRRADVRAPFNTASLIDDLNVAGPDDPAHETLMGELLKQAAEACKDTQNPERDLLIFNLYYLAGFTASEAAHIVPGLTQRTVESVLHRVVDRVRRREARE